VAQQVRMVLVSRWGKTMNEPATVLTDRYAAAVAYASTIHATQVRKGTAVPYLAHLLGVSSLVLEAGGTEDEAIAGLLHDAVEDCGGLPRLADVRARFGDTVADIVLTCSDSTDEEWKKTADYQERKDAYLAHLRQAEARAVMVSIADKVHNARALVTDLQRQGPAVLGKFNGTGDQILGYYRACCAIGEDKAVPDAVLLPLRTAITEIATYIEDPA
jgi:(p)ppGpp synthase/HD superfamily hydrolase